MPKQTNSTLRISKMCISDDATTSKEDPSADPNFEKVWGLPGFSPRERLRFLYNSKFGSDITIVLKENGNLFHCHKLILSMASPVFEKLFIDDQTIAQLKCEYDVQAFEWFLKRAYDDSMTYPCEVEIVVKIYDLLNQLEMFDDLKELCAHLVSIISILNVDEFYGLAIHHKDYELQEKCCSFVIDHCSKILEAAPFGLISRRVLKLAVSQDGLKLPEIEIFKAVIAWSKANLTLAGEDVNGENIRRISGPIWKEIDFLNLTLEEVLKDVHQEDIFTDSELLAILQQSQRVYSKITSEEEHLEDFPVELRTWPRIRNYIPGEQSLMSVHLIMNLICNVKNVWTPVTGVQLVLLQVDNDIQLFRIRSRGDCHLGNSFVQVFRHDSMALLGTSQKGPSWQFSPPIDVLKNETYIFVLSGTGKILRHETNIFSVSALGMEFSGQCLTCDISLGFKRLLNVQEL